MGSTERDLQSDDSEFWDEGGKNTLKNQGRKQIERTGSTSFPSYSDYISRQQSQKEVFGKSQGTNTSSNVTTSISVDSETIGMIEREQRKSIGERGSREVKDEEGDDDEYEYKESFEELDSSSSLRDGNGSSEEANEDKRSPRDKAYIYINDKDSSSDGEDGDENKIVFFDNSEPKNLTQIRRMSLGLLDEPSSRSSFSSERKLVRPSKKKKTNLDVNSAVSDNENLSKTALRPPPQLLKFWLYRGRKFMAVFDGQMAVDAFVRSFALSRIIHGDKSWRTARCKVFLSRAYFYILNYTEPAFNHASEATEFIVSEIRTSVYLNKKPQIHHTLSWGFLVQGGAKCALGLPALANPFYTKAMVHCKKFQTLVTRRKKLKPSMKMDDPSVLIVKILGAQAEAYKKSSNLCKAREKLEEALAIVNTRSDLERWDLMLGSLLNELGELLLKYAGKVREGAAGEEEEARDKEEGFNYLRKSLEITQSNQRPGNENECAVRFLIIQYQIKYKEIPIKDILWELHKLKIWSVRLHGEAGSPTMAIQEFLIQVLLDGGSYKEAIEEMQSLLKNVRNNCGDYNNQVCAILRKMSNTYLLQNDHAQAISTLDRCLLVETLLFGLSSRRVQTLKTKMKNLLYEVPPAVKNQILRKHPELQQKPPFKAY